jgi:hypothetical protein
MKKKYKTVCMISPGKLDSMVNSYLEVGCELHGNPYTYERRGHGTYFCQVVIIKENNEEETTEKRTA